EFDKRATALLASATPMIVFDNVVRLTSPALAAILTAPFWSGRVLKESKMISLPNRAIWLATGNNVELSDELVRRTVHIRLDAGTERPEERQGWRHPDLLGWAKANRADLVSACASIVQHWVDDGMREGNASLGRFESWAAVLGGILNSVGIEGFLCGRDR